MAYDEKAKIRSMKYLAKLKEIRFRVKPEEYELFRKAAEDQHYKSMRQFFLDAIYEKMASCSKVQEVEREPFEDIP